MKNELLLFCWSFLNATRGRQLEKKGCVPDFYFMITIFIYFIIFFSQINYLNIFKT